MTIRVPCPSCGRVLRTLAKHAGRRAHCPDCGSEVVIPTPDEFESEADRTRPTMPVTEFLDDADADAAFTSTERPSGVLERMFDVLLDPRSIHWMLGFGGGLTVLGLVVWLVSIGVFDDPRVVAGSLIAGASAVVGAGWFVSLRTRFRLAGHALTFLGCVLLPLNIWFVRAQGLVEPGSLWLGGVLCSAVYVATLLKLRSPVFMYAVEAGVTLTVGLLLYDFGHLAEIHAVSLLLLGLGLVSIHAERAFDPDGEFDRRRYGLPLFRCGHVQIAASLVLLLTSQLTDWVLNPLLAREWAGNLFTDRFPIAIGAYLAAAYAYLYSDLVVRRNGLFTYAAGICLVLAQLTLFVDSTLPFEYFLAALAVTAVVVNWLASRSHDEIPHAARPIGLVLSGLPLLCGFGLHLAASSEYAVAAAREYDIAWPYVVAMLVTAVCSRISAWVDRHRSLDRVTIHFLFSAGATLLAAAGVLRMNGVVDWPHQALWLMPIPLASLVGARLWRNQAAEWPLYRTAHACTALIMLSLLFAARRGLDLLLPVTADAMNLVIGAVFVEALAFYTLAGLLWRRGRNAYFAAIAACGALWQFLAYANVSSHASMTIYALLGVGFLVVARVLGVARTRVFDGDGRPRQVSGGRGLPAMQCGIAIVLLAATSAGLNGLVLLASQNASWPGLTTLLVTTAASGLAVALLPYGGWRRLFAAMAIALAGIDALTVNALSTLSGLEKFEIFTTAVGLLAVVAAHVHLFGRDAEKPHDGIGFALFAGSLLASLPIGVIAIRDHLAVGGFPSWEAFAVVAVTILMLWTGVAFKVKATTLVGGGVLGTYLLAIIGNLAYDAQASMGVYLAVGGALVFATGLTLSVYRDTIRRLPQSIANGEGVFRVLQWR